MVENNICASCKRCCMNSEFIGLVTKNEIEVIEKKLDIKLEVKKWHHPGIYEMTSVPCQAFIDRKCALTPDERPCTCLLFPFRPDYDEVNNSWDLDLAVTKCPGALSFSFHSDEAKELFVKMKESGRWKI